MKKPFGSLLVAALVAFAILSGSDARAARKGPEVSTQGLSVAAAAQAMSSLHTPA